MACEHCITDPDYAWVAVAGFALICLGYWLWLFRGRDMPPERQPPSP